MEKIRVIEREMTSSELEQMNAGFDAYALDNGVAIQDSDRFGFLALESDDFIGCSSGLAYRNGAEYNGWFYLTDLFVKKAYRMQGIGSILLKSLEERISSNGIINVWTWTGEYEAKNFYMRHGYEVFIEMKNWYSNSDSRVGLKKVIQLAN